MLPVEGFGEKGDTFFELVNSICKGVLSLYFSATLETFSAR